jgi:hypothetical protein
MAINIKELFSTDSATDHLDKVNYNFDQIVANGGGPTGAQGSKGDLGPQGNKGNKGDQGIAGPQGDPGIATDYFFRNDNGTKFTYTPRQDDATAPLGYSKPASLILGDAPLDPFSTSSETDALLYVKQFDHPYLAKFGTDNTDEFVTLSITADGVDRVLTWAPTALGASTQKYVFNGDTIVLNGGTGEVIKLDSTASEIASSLLISGTLRISSGGPGSGKVLTSNATGVASWTAPYETPVGTIVMVPKFVLDPANGYINWTSTGILGTDYVGRGNAGTDWEGWYYCWGQTWGTYETPDMREAMPVGFVNTAMQGAGGYSAEVYTANGTLTTNKGRVDALQAIDTGFAAPHSHVIKNVALGGGGYAYTDISAGTTAKYVPYVTSSTGQISTGTSGTSAVVNNVNVVPPGTVVGFMIYLGSATLTYDTSGGGGPLPVGP